ncbi:MAG: glycosyl hydrolase family 31, partial [Bacteroidales bacterium]
MKITFLFLSLSLLIFGCTPKESFVKVETSAGPLLLTPMTENSVRVQVLGAPTHDVEELIFTEEFKSPEFSVKKDDSSIILQTSKMMVQYDKSSESLIFFDAQGHELFREKPGSRILKQSTVMGDSTYEASQSYIMQPGDHQFGTGQFQDNQLDIFGLSRRLTQNNTQIVSPVIISSKGYGILWHNYGRTDFNPCET